MGNQSPNPWHVSFSYARALQNTTLKIWAGKDDNTVSAQSKLFQRASANSKAQMGKYDKATANEDATAAESMYVKDYSYWICRPRLLRARRADKARIAVACRN